jgi:benzodiazapine receptor
VSSLASRRPLLGLIGWLAFVFLAAAVAAFASRDAGSLYGQLVLPRWAPPAWLFGPVWTVLYAMMAIAAWLIWRLSLTWVVRGALRLFVAQLLLNALWSWLFFRWHRGGLAFADSVLLCTLVALTAFVFWRLRTLAGVLLLPYLMWVSFALFLNYSIWQLNPQSLG